MGDGFLNDDNKPRFNFVPHTASSDTERGLPALMKLVGRLDSSVLEVCTDTAPDPTEDGGGTWAPLLTGLAGFQTFTPTLTATTTDPTIDPGISTQGAYVTLGPICAAWWCIRFGASMNAGSGLWRLNKPIPSASGASSSFCVGTGLILDNSAVAGEFVILENRSVNDFYITYEADTVAHNKPWAWAPNDEMRLFAVYPIA